MDFEDALSVLLGWLGVELQVTLHGAFGVPPTIAAELFGTLRCGDELSRGLGPANSIVFVLDSEDEHEASTFILDKAAFLGAGWFDEDEEVLAINCGLIQFLICLADT